jgi:tetratricopeptide (TPR) repeat protein
VLAHVYTELGRQKEARDVFETLASHEFGALPFDDEWIFGASLLTEVAEGLEDAPRVRTLYKLLLPYADRNAVSNPDICIGSVSRNLGILAARLCQWREAARHFEDALAMNARNNARPWLARAQHDYARMLLAREEPGDRERAAELLARALETCRALEMAALMSKVLSLLDATGGGAAAPQTQKVVPIRPRAETQPSVRPTLFRREGEYWLIAFEGQTLRLTDTKGLRHLARLLGEPGREFHVLDLVAAELGGQVDLAAGESGKRSLSFDLGDAGEILDPEAKAAYRRRLADLDEELKEAAEWDDPGRIERAEEEKDFLIQQLASAVGLGGRDRRAASAAERARVNVTRAIRGALLKIREHSADLHRHLDTTIRTGTFCSYTPDPRSPISWRL